MRGVSALVVLVFLGRAAAAQDVGTPKVVEFGFGFYGFEQNKTERWRWMGDEAEVKLWNAHQPMVLKIEGRAPLMPFDERPKLSITLNGKSLDEFELPTETVNKEFTIDAAQLGSEDWTALRLRTSKTSAPKDVFKDSKDARQLGFKLYALTWETKSGEPVAAPTNPFAQRRLVWILSAAAVFVVVVLVAVFGAWRLRRRAR